MLSPAAEIRTGGRADLSSRVCRWYTTSTQESFLLPTLPALAKANQERSSYSLNCTQHHFVFPFQTYEIACVAQLGQGKGGEMNIDWSKWALLTTLALYTGTLIATWWWAVELLT